MNRLFVCLHSRSMREEGEEVEAVGSRVRELELELEFEAELERMEKSMEANECEWKENDGSVESSWCFVLANGQQMAPF